MTTTKCDVVVVGAGVSGMTAAYRLKRKDPSLHVVVVEAKDRIGGRTYTVPLKASSGTDQWDLGGQWVGRCQPHIMSLLEELKLDVYPQFLSGVKVMQLGDNRIRTYKSDIPSLSFFALIDLQHFVNKTNRLAKEIDVNDPWKCRRAAQWDAMTVDTFIRQTAWTTGAREAAESASRTMFGMEASQMSLLFYLSYVSAADGLKNLIEATEGTAQEFKIKGGAQQVSQKMAETVGADNIQLNQPVRSIVQSDTSVIVTTSPGHRYECKRTICAMPPPLLGNVAFSPPLPHTKQELMKRMPLGSMVKVIITYRKAFWKDAGYSGEVVSNGGPPNLQSCDSGAVGIVYDASSPNGNPALVAFLGGRQATMMGAVSSAHRQRSVLHQLVTYFGDSVLEYLEYREMDWNTETPFTGGPVCCVGPGAMEYFSAGLRDPHERVHFAGTETATQWCGYISGAVQAGYRAATEVMTHIHPDLVTQDDLDLFQTKVRRSHHPSSVPWVKLSIGFGVVGLLGIVLSKKIDILSKLEMFKRMR